MWTRPILLIGLISFFADVASDMLYPIWPLYLTGSLGASLVALGFIEGLAELIAGLFKILAGRWSDRMGRRKIFVFSGYFLAAISKPIAGVATNWVGALSAKALDRFGKGMRTAPRDAMLSDWAPKGQEARVFGFHRSMDSAGATVGPLITLLILAMYPEIALSRFFLWALIPGLIAALLVLGIPEKKLEKKTEILPDTQTLRESLSQFSKEFYIYLAIWILFSLGNSSDVFLLLRIQNLGASTQQVVLSFCFYNLVYAILSYPVGIWADRKGTKSIFMYGLFIFAIVYGIFASAHHWWILLPGLFLYGIFSAATDGVGKAMVIGMAPKNQKATAIGLFVGGSGFAMLVASVSTGWIWENFGSQWALGISSGIALIAAVLFYLKSLKLEKS